VKTVEQTSTTMDEQLAEKQRCLQPILSCENDGRFAEKPSSCWKRSPSRSNAESSGHTEGQFHACWQLLKLFPRHARRRISANPYRQSASASGSDFLERRTSKQTGNIRCRSWAPEWLLDAIIAWIMCCASLSDDAHGLRSICSRHLCLFAERFNFCKQRCRRGNESAAN